jgi:hypothetical protein
MAPSEALFNTMATRVNPAVLANKYFQKYYWEMRDISARGRPKNSSE